MNTDVFALGASTSNAATSLLELKEAGTARCATGFTSEVNCLHTERTLEPLALLGCIEVAVAELS